jgi:hypothetical protein
MPLLLSLLTIGRLFSKAIRTSWVDPELRGLILLTLSNITLGAWFYRSSFEPGIDNWTDGFYFAVATLSTVGYGDFAPTTPISKWFTIFYILSGLGILGAFVAVIGENLKQESAERARQRQAKRN